jgi:hypothetical protein
LPPYDGHAKVVDVFRGEPMLMDAVHALETIIFQTNPFDILSCVEKALGNVERAAFHFNHRKTYVFPFEVTFGLFLGVAMAADIPSWVHMAQFIEAYTPASGLCPAFEFARAEVVACLMHFRQMIQAMDQGRPID